jgi:signal transduction histidine kinase
MEGSGGLPVLVVDDDRTVLAMLRSWLQQQGWEPECHQDPLAALEAYTHRRHLAVVADWNMPELDGLELVRRLRSRNQSRSAYVLLVTASDRSDILHQAFELGVDDFLRKPLDKLEFTARMKAARRVCQLEEEVRNRSERELERRMHAMALQRVSAVVGAVVHELRTPLAAVRLSAERLRGRPDRISPEALPILDRIDLGVGQLADSLDNVLEAFGMSVRPSRWGLFSPTRSVQEAVEASRESVRDGVDLRLELEPGSEEIQGLGDGASVRRLAQNLLANALWHTGQGSVRLRVGKSPGGFRLEVVDSGDGIPEELLPWLGEPLLLNSENGGLGRFVHGNGMGLSLCRRIVQRHGGSFSIRSLARAGTHVSATLRLDLAVPASMEETDNFYAETGAP